jgi:translation initiation factor IF-2
MYRKVFISRSVNYIGSINYENFNNIGEKAGFEITRQNTGIAISKNKNIQILNTPNYSKIRIKCLSKAPQNSDDQHNKTTNAEDRRKINVKSKNKKSKNISCGSFQGHRAARVLRKDARTRFHTESVKEEIIEVPSSGIYVHDLAKKIACSPAYIIKTLFMKGIRLQVNQQLDRAMVEMVCETKGIEVISETDNILPSTKDFQSDNGTEFLAYRAPIVTLMGHVDHGKTSLLDYIRKSSTASDEIGGITQGVSSYNVHIENIVNNTGVKNICFMDTPGHEAFSSMRSRGAKITDIIVIIVAADDGIKPQTLEAISHARDENIPTVVAVNKIDKAEADPEKVKQKLTEFGILPEEWGGTTPVIEISAKTGFGVPELLENVSLIADLQELKTNPFQLASGIILEASLDKFRGPVASVITHSGTLRVGDIVLVGHSYGKVRALQYNSVFFVKEAYPSTSLELIGLNFIPRVGEKFLVLPTETEAKQRAEAYTSKKRHDKLSDSSRHMAKPHSTQIISILLKCDNLGSVEAIKTSLTSLPQDKISIRFIVAEPGEVTESDVEIAAIGKNLIFSFNQKTSNAVLTKAKAKGVQIKSYKGIYDLIEGVRDVMENELPTTVETDLVGIAEVNNVFPGGISGKVAGCVVLSGRVLLGELCLIRRKNSVLCKTKLLSLRRIKEQLKMVKAGDECGIDVEGFKEWEVGDLVECFESKERKTSLEETNEMS